MRLIKRIIRKKRIACFIFCLFFVVAMHWSALEVKILTVKPETYHELAVDLKITPEYRYGYHLSWHGAILVKTPNVEGASPQVVDEEAPDEGNTDEPLPDEYTTDNDHVIGSSPEDQTTVLPDGSLEVIMRDELALVPLKFTLELALYILLMLYAFFGVRWIRTKLHVNTWRSRCIFMTATWIVFWIIAFLPFMLCGYGYPLHSNWLGPGALSYSYSPFILSTGSGLTISYRHVIDILSTYPIILFALIAQVLQYVPVIGSNIHLR